MMNEMTRRTETGMVAPVETATTNLQSMMNYARTNPRNVKRFLEEAATLATIDEETAASCWYTLKRGGKKIEGPSARLAEFCQTAWGNLWVDVVCNEPLPGQTTVTAEGRAIDLEKNTAVKLQVTRTIVDRNGNRYSPDMVALTMQVAIAIAHRNAVFKLIPGTYVRAIMMKARTVAAGNEASLTKKRTSMVEWFKKRGVSEKELLHAVDCPSIDDVGLSELAELRGMANAIEQGESSVETMFKAPARKESKTKAEALFDEIEAEFDAAPVEPEKPTLELDANAAEKKRAIANIKKILDGRKLPHGVFDALESVDIIERERILVGLLDAPLELVEAALGDADPTATFRQMADVASSTRTGKGK